MAIKSALLVLCSVLLTGASTAPGSQPRQLKISGIEESLKKSSHLYRAAAAQTRAAKAHHKGSYNHYLPRLVWESSWSRLDRDLTIDVGPKRVERDILGGALNVAIEVDPPPIEIQERDVGRSTLKLKQPLYTGGLIAAGVNASEAAHSLSMLHQKDTLNQQLQLAYSLYFKTQALTATITLLEELQASFRETESITKALVQQGVVPGLSELQIRAHRSSVDAKLVGLVHSRRTALQGLGLLLGIERLEASELVTRLRAIDIDTAVTSTPSPSMVERLELDARQRQLAALDQKNRSSLLPKVFAFGNYEVYREDLNALDPHWAVGVGVSFPVTGGLDYTPEKRRIVHLRRALQLAEEGLEAKIAVELDQAHNTYRGARESLGAMEISLAAAREAWRLARVRYRVGQGSSFEMIQVAVSYQQLAIQEVTATLQVVEAAIAVYAASGYVAQFAELFPSSEKGGQP